MTTPPFYSGELNAATYDLEPGREKPWAGDDVAFYRDLAIQSGSRVLELACGTGRIAIPLAEAGFTVTGLDLAPSMLRVAERKAARVPEPVRTRLRFVRGDMASFALGEVFDTVLIAVRSFQFLLTSDAQRACLGRVRDHLRPGGTFALHLFDPLLDLCVPGAFTPHSSARLDPATGNTIEVETVERTNDPLAQVLRETWRFRELDPSGQMRRAEDEELALRWTYRYEMRHLLELAGFEVVAEYSDFAGGRPRYGAEQVWVARRPE